ncbi:hypothetical protein [Phytohalomonas tamaricis]|uniref:hypothetical protein n=1 Tax=Phytohalomonas tamaricis TaxID=2081032 RepID=UPI00131A1050|nr:hypothetical protein [Phytohalomonas tamaricis]
MIQRGLSLRKDTSITLETIDALEVDMAQADVADRLAWLLHWLRGVLCYRAEDCTSAAIHYQQAFDAAKYTAGSYQYKLVNQYTKSWQRPGDGCHSRKAFCGPVIWGCRFAGFARTSPLRKIWNGSMGLWVWKI